MKKLRIIPRLDIKGPKVVKGIKLEGIRVVGDPMEFAKCYYEQGADEILYMDVVASLYERNSLLEIVEQTTSNQIFIPVTVGGGIRSIEDIRRILCAGADKVAINTAATKNPQLITEAAKIFGSQCIVGSIEAKYCDEGRWEAYVDSGREPTGKDAIEWAKELVNLGVGELLVTSIDKEGTEEGYELELIKKISEAVPVPVVACGGAGKKEDVLKCFQETRVDGVSFASILHYKKTTIDQVKQEVIRKGLALREVSSNCLNNINNQINDRKEVSIIDYGAGNLKSVTRAFESVGNKVKLINTPEEVQKAELLVLPGDGAFGSGMESLNRLGLVESIKEYIKKKKHFLGICLGMQLLMTESEEFGDHKGLDIIEGKVIHFKKKDKVEEEMRGEKLNYQVPHMGWNNIKKREDSFLSEIPEDAEFYFIHSYYVSPKEKIYSLAETEHGGQRFCSIIRKGNVIGTQFHPEKSGFLGIKLIEYFGGL